MGMEWLKNAKADDPSTWPTKRDLREHLGLQNRTIERWANKPGKLRTQQRRPPGHKSIPVYHPDDVRQIWSETMPVASQNDTTATPVEVRQVARKQATIATPEVVLAEVLQTLPALLGKEQKILLTDALLSLTRLSLAAKTFLSLSEASVLLGISEDRIKTLANQGVIPAIKGKGKSGRWTFCQADFLACNLSTLMQLPEVSLVMSTANKTTQSDNENGHVSH
jgi:hypothetical protein